MVFFIDTDSELNYEHVKSLGIDTKVIRMPYSIDDEEIFADITEFNSKEFFDKLRNGSKASTAGLNVADYINYFEPYVAQGEEIFYISFGASFSGTFNYLDMALKELKEKYPNMKFTRFDTNAISLATGIQIMAGARMLKEGKSVEEVVAELTELSKKVNLSIVADDLQYLKRGGRLSAGKALIGSILKVKPYIKLTQDGKLRPVASVPGRNKALMMAINDTANEAIDVKLPIVIMNADCNADAERAKARLNELRPELDVWICDIGPVIGAHCGPGALGIIYVGGDRPVINV